MLDSKKLYKVKCSKCGYKIEIFSDKSPKKCQKCKHLLRKQLNVLLIDPFAQTYGKFNRNIGKVLPLGLGYIAGVSVKRGDNVQFLDLAVNPMQDDEIEKYIKKFKPDIIGFTATILTIKHAYRIATICKKAVPCITILGGSHASLYPDKTLKENSDIDILVLGEGEKTWDELLSTIQDKKDLAKVDGIMFRKRNNFVRTKPREYIKNLDEVPKIPYQLFPVEKYIPQAMYYHQNRLPAFTIITSRGCPFQCTFCPKPVFGNKYRTQSAERVFEDIKELVDNYGAKEIIFYDDTFNLHRDRMIKICDLIIENKLDITWNAMTRVDLIDYELLKRMKESGCWQLVFGIESAHQELLDRIKKGITLDQIRESISWCRELGITTRGSFMLGMPGETLEMGKKTVDFAIELDLDYANFCVTVPHYNTELYATCKEFGEVRDDADWDDFNLLNEDNPIFVNKDISQESLAQLFKSAWRRFYLRPGYIWKQTKMLAKSPSDIIKLAKGFWTVVELNLPGK